MKVLHPPRSWASHRSSYQFLPASVISSTVRLHVPNDLPGFLLLGGTHVNTACGCGSFFMRSTWPSYNQHLFLTSRIMLFMPALSHTSLLVTLCSHQICRILLRHLLSQPPSLLSIFLFVLQVSDAYSRIEHTFDW